MQKVEGSSPFIRFIRKARKRRAFLRSGSIPWPGAEAADQFGGPSCAVRRAACLYLATRIHALRSLECLFDLVGSRVRVRHLCVDPDERGKGFARQLVEELV